MSTCADLRGAAHGGLLRRVFEEAHLVQRATQVALLLGAQRAIADTTTHFAQPAVQSRFQPRMRGEREPDGVAVFQQLGQLGVEFSDRKSLRHAQGGGRGSRAQAVTVPDLALQVFGLAKEGALPVTGEHQPRLRFGKTGEVVEVAVVPVDEVAVAVARAL